MKNLQNIITLTLTVAFFALNSTTGSTQIRSSSKLGVDVNIGSSSFTNELVNVQIKEVVPPVSWVHERRVHKNFSIGTEIGFAKYDARANGAAQNAAGVGEIAYGIYGGWAALRAVIHYPVNEMIEIYGGGSARYSVVYIQNNNSIFENLGNPTAKRMDGLGLGGVNLNLGEGFGLFAEGGILKDNKYFRVGIVLSK